MRLFFVITAWLLMLSTADIRSCRVPVWMLAIGVGGISVISAGRLFCGITGLGGILCGAIPGLALLMLALVSRLVGYADGVVLVCLGVIGGLKSGVMTLLIGLLFASLCSILLLAIKRVKKTSQIPFIPFLLASWVLTTVGA